MDTNIIKNGIPFTGKLVITVNDGEIPVSPGDFWRMESAGMFSVVKRDDNDQLKLIGCSHSGEIYVSQKTIPSLTEDESVEYRKRAGIESDYGMDSDVPPISVEDEKFWASSETEIYEARWVSEAKDLTEIDYNKASY